MPRRLRFTAEQMIGAVSKARGLVSFAAELLGCDQDTVYNYAKRFPTVQHAIDAARDRQLDKAENKLFNAVDDGQAWAVCFYLKTKGKARGYIERQEVTGKDGEELVIKYVNDWRNLAADAAPGAANGHAQPGALASDQRRPEMAQNDNGNGHGG